jgi:hypothetical protein
MCFDAGRRAAAGLRLLLRARASKLGLVEFIHELRPAGEAGKQASTWRSLCGSAQLLVSACCFQPNIALLARVHADRMERHWRLQASERVGWLMCFM